MSLPYYKKYPRDFFEGTVGMPLDLKGAYDLVLDLIFMQSGGLRDDPHYISGHLGCSVRKWNTLKNELIKRGKIRCENGIVDAPILAKWRRFRREAISTAVRKEVYERDGAVCVYCDSEVGPFHLDHIHPWSKGGESTAENLAVACQPCNLSKGDKSLEEWLQ